MLLPLHCQQILVNTHNANEREGGTSKENVRLTIAYWMCLLKKSFFLARTTTKVTTTVGIPTEKSFI